jgi:hypothetical protein
MTTHITQEQAEAFAHRRATKYVHRTAPGYASYAFVPHTLMDFVRDIEAAAIQHYRDSLVAGVVLPELPDPDYLGADGVGDIFGYEERHMQDYARQAIADALAKQVTRAPMFEFRECDDSQAAAPELKFTNARRAALREVKNSNPISIGHARTLEQHGLIVWLAERNRFLLSSSGASLLEKWESLAAAPDPKEGA